ncbi:MAG: hypothetical protein GF309_06975 [Candidatus Lokiarchaeota archaeon]|nr:hypothetical protein [Candidatus Lokiarchaeota archaeon]
MEFDVHKNMEKFDSQTGLLRLILILDDARRKGENRIVSELGRAVGTSNYYRSLRILQQYGLATKEQEKGRVRVNIVLTDKGIEVAKHLKAIEEILS